MYISIASFDTANKAMVADLILRKIEGSTTSFGNSVHQNCGCRFQDSYGILCIFVIHHKRAKHSLIVCVRSAEKFKLHENFQRTFRKGKSTLQVAFSLITHRTLFDISKVCTPGKMWALCATRYLNTSRLYIQRR